MKSATQLTLLVLFALVVSLTYAADECLDNSYAIPTSNFFSISGIPSSMDDGFAVVWNVALKIRSPYFVNVFYGLSNGDFYLLKNCKSTANIGNAYCGSSQYLAYIRHSSHGHNKRVIHAVLANGTLSTMVGVESADYDTTSKGWYTKGNGWTDVYTFASGGSGRTYCKSFTNGVTAVDRDAREPCSACLENSYTVPASRIMTGIPELNEYATITTKTGLVTPIRKILDLMNQVSVGYTINMYIGFDNNDFYGVLNCGTDINKNIEICKKANTPFVALIRNTAALSSVARKTFALTADGLMSEDALDVTSASTEYATTQRPWYTSSNGFSDSYLFAAQGVSGRTYSLNFIGGVSGSDTLNEPCKRVACNATITNVITIDNTTKVIANSGVVTYTSSLLVAFVMSIAAMLF